MYISQLYIYPIKSLGGIALQESHTTSRGLEYDRRFMIVDASGKFISQREYPKMTLIQVSIQHNLLHIISPEMSFELILEAKPSFLGKQQYVKVWDDEVMAWHVSQEADAWFSEVLGDPCSLVYMPDESERKVEEKYAKKGEITSFSDAFPILITSEESLNDLNSRLVEPVEMIRFRPNIVVAGASHAYAENEWHELKTPDTALLAKKPCGRCVMITIDTETAQKTPEPLRTLATYKKQGNKVIFGENILVEKNGMLKVGDEIKVFSWKED